MSVFRKHPWTSGFCGLFAVFVLASLSAGYAPGMEIGRNFLSFFWQMIRVLPCVFILIGLFDVWIKRETVERHLGRESGLLGYVWAVLLAGSTVGGLHIALPVAHALYVKRARLGIVLAFILSAGVCRIPMTLFEASFLGWRFTGVRFLVSLPLVVLCSAVVGKWFEKRGYRLPDIETAENEENK